MCETAVIYGSKMWVSSADRVMVSMMSLAKVKDRNSDLESC